MIANEHDVVGMLRRAIRAKGAGKGDLPDSRNQLAGGVVKRSRRCCPVLHLRLTGIITPVEGKTIIGVSDGIEDGGGMGHVRLCHREHERSGVDEMSGDDGGVWLA